MVTGGPTKISGAMVGSEQPVALGTFCTKILGQPSWQADEWFGWSGGTKLMIGPHSAVRAQSTSPERHMILLEVDDVATSFVTLQELGANVVAEPHQPEGGDGIWLATVSDMDDNYLQLQTPWQ
jgi:predicted enzyme related to lactoylglutathione lyase